LVFVAICATNGSGFRDPPFSKEVEAETRRGAMPRICLLIASLSIALGSVAGLAPAARAQVRYLPASEYDHINVRTPQSLQARVESLQQSNDFERLVTFKEDSRYRRAGAPVGRLKMRKQDSNGREGVGLCTASLISPEYALTNHHCIPGIDGWRTLEAQIEMNYLDAKDTSRVRAFAIDVRPVETSEALDYTILRVAGNPSAQFGTVKLASSPPGVQDALFVIQHPEGAPKIVSRKDCAVRVLSAPDFVHTCDTLGGSSGSPIFSDESLEMVGLHFAGSEEGNYGKEMSELVHKSRILQGLVVVAAPAPAPAAANRPAPPEPVAVSLTSEPAGAAIYLGEVLIGLTPHQFAMAAQPRMSFTLRKPGFTDEPVELTPRGGKAELTARLRPAAGQPGRPVKPAAGEVPSNPALDQARKALALFDEMEKSGWAGAQAPGPAAVEQKQKADSMFDQFEKDKPGNR
jgi:hypothetical protein